MRLEKFAKFSKLLLEKFDFFKQFYPVTGQVLVYKIHPLYQKLLLE